MSETKHDNNMSRIADVIIEWDEGMGDVDCLLAIREIMIDTGYIKGENQNAV